MDTMPPRLDTLRRAAHKLRPDVGDRDAVIGAAVGLVLLAIGAGALLLRLAMLLAAPVTLAVFYVATRAEDRRRAQRDTETAALRRAAQGGQ